jgi:hypothetical protein
MQPKKDMEREEGRKVIRSHHTTWFGGNQVAETTGPDIQKMVGTDTDTVKDSQC